MNEYKKNLTLEICDFLRSREEVLAIWEGGSAATGFEDEWSDLDLITVTEQKAGDEIFEGWIASGLFTRIVRRYRVPEPTWHGMSQCFYQLKDSPEFFMRSATVAKDNPNKLTERIVTAQPECITIRSAFSQLPVRRSRIEYHRPKGLAECNRDRFCAEHRAG